MRETAIALGVQGDLVVQIVVCSSREAHGRSGIGFDLHAGARLGKNEQLDPGVGWRDVE